MSDTPELEEESYIDTTHKYISDKVKIISGEIDNTLNDSLNYLTNKDKNDKKKDIDSLNTGYLDKSDALFQNDKYLDDVRKSYLQLTTEYNANSNEDNKFKTKLNAKLILNKSKKNFRLFIKGADQDNINNIIDSDADSEDSPEIGVSVIKDISKKLESKYSLGIRSFHPFIRARYTYKTKTEHWNIEPAQTFQYSMKDDFKEDTKLYLDTKIQKKLFFRTELGRGTKSREEGMLYNSKFSLFWTPQKDTGIQLSQNFQGHTKYEYTSSGTTKEFQGIINYSTQIKFRQNIYKKWMFYELSPKVNFHRDDDFESTFSFRASLEFFFGNI